MKKLNFIKYIIISILIMSMLTGCSVLKPKQSVYKTLEELFVSVDYENVYNEYGNFFNDPSKIEALKKERSDDYEVIISSYQSKYLVSVLCVHKDEYLNQFENMTKDMSEFDFSKLLLNTYQTLMRDTKENDELCSQIVETINETEVNFENSDYASLYSAFVCFCNMTIHSRQENADKADEIIVSLKERYGENFQDFWYNESTQYSGILLLNKWYDRFKTVFMSACSVEGYSPAICISYLINMKGLNKDQLTFLSDTLYELSYATEDYNKKEALKEFAELARTQKSKNT